MSLFGFYQATHDRDLPAIKNEIEKLSETIDEAKPFGVSRIAYLESIGIESDAIRNSLNELAEFADYKTFIFCHNRFGIDPSHEAFVASVKSPNSDVNVIKFFIKCTKHPVELSADEHQALTICLSKKQISKTSYDIIQNKMDAVKSRTK